MRYSGIGGQAVMEGVMMKNQEKYAVAVRKPDQEIVVETSTYEGLIKNKKIRNMPILRGVFSFIESLVLGMKTLTLRWQFLWCFHITYPYSFSVLLHRRHFLRCWKA